VRPSYTLRHFRTALLLFLTALLVAWLAFALILKEGALNALYRATITLSLTGLDTLPKNAGGKVATILVIVSGMAIYGYLASVFVEVIAHGVLTGAVGERQRRRKIERLRDHYVICGYGRVGRRVAREFREARVPYVVLDFSEEAIEIAREENELFVEGSGTSDDDLAAAGLARARGLVASADSDVDNLYIVVSARSERPDLLIVARASTGDAAAKMLRAGANRVVQPYTAAGQEMAKLVLRPQVAAFLDIVTSAGGPDLRMEEIEVTEACRQAGSSIRDLRIRRETGALVVAVRRQDGTFDATPSPDFEFDVGDVLIAVGTEDELRALEELFRPREAVAG
jgi:voltage-gated potassium channel